MQLIIEPEDGVAPLLAAIKKATKTVDITIFRFDHGDVEVALKQAAARGVKVNALIANANRGGEEHLRRLEMRFLAAGINVARTAAVLSRYHDKLLIIDRRILYLLSFNFTHLDIDHSRGFGIISRNARLVREALKLFEADRRRIKYSPALADLVVSPDNARAVLAKFLSKAKKELLIYDPKIADRAMIRILEERAKAGVDVRIIGSINVRFHLSCRTQHQLRLHTRTIIRDHGAAFVGSQSLRRPELDSRREVGLILREAKIVKRLHETFEAEWEAMGPGKGLESTKAQPLPATRPGAEAADEVLAEEHRPLDATVKDAVKSAVADAGGETLTSKQLKHAVQEVVEKAVKEAVLDAVHEVLEDAKKS